MFSGGSLIFSLICLFGIFCISLFIWDMFWSLIEFSAELLVLYTSSFLKFVFTFIKEFVLITISDFREKMKKEKL